MANLDSQVRYAWIAGYVDRWMTKLSGDPDGCWLWTGNINRGGYATVHIRRQECYLHRITYTIARGAIPDGLQIDHLCRIRHCVNPKHLEAVTQQENMRRGLCGVLKTHCKHGHSLDDAILLSRGERLCRQCNARRNRAGKAYRRALKAQA